MTVKVGGLTMKEIQGQYFPVLDHGFVALKDHMGDDHAIAEMARTSYGLGTKKISNDDKLIRYLMEHKHTSPFERCEIVLHVGLPIFVARQWVRHRTASLNEYSGRYSVMPMLFYTPERERCQKQDTKNKQGSSPELVYDSKEDYQDFKDMRKILRGNVTAEYNTSLKEGLSRELARIDLPLSMYTYWYWKIDLHNLLHFLELRLAENAQWEIRQYAQIIAGIVQKWLPLTWKAFVDYRLNAVSFSSIECQLLSHMLTIDDHHILLNTANHLKMSEKEVDEFYNKFKKSVQSTQYILPEPKSAEYYEKLIKESISND